MVKLLRFIIINNNLFDKESKTWITNEEIKTPICVGRFKYDKRNNKWYFSKNFFRVGIGENLAAKIFEELKKRNKKI